MRRLSAEIDQLRGKHAYRSLTLSSGRDFTSNDYLGLARHPALRAAAAAAMQEFGVAGAGGSRLLRGHHELHAQLEERAAKFFGSEKALYFGSGFLANLALFSTLCGRHDAVIFDERAHASIKEGIRASPAARYRAAHNDLESFEKELRRARENSAQGLWIAVESLYSMDGDFAPLAELAALARTHDAMLVIDEAHATGVFGARGRGLSEGLEDGHLIAVHTCGKALGVAGGLICAKAGIIEYLINKARPFIYSTAPPPMLAAALIRALELVGEEPERRERVKSLSRHAKDRLTASAGKAVLPSGSQIIPVVLHEDERAVSAAAALQAAGFDVRAIRSPTVPRGTARLRISINAGHREDEIAALADALGRVLAKTP